MESPALGWPSQGHTGPIRTDVRSKGYFVPVDVDFESKDGMELLKDAKFSSKVCH